MTDGLTPADISAITGGNNNGMWGDGAWWIIVLFIFAFSGWGNSGFGGNGGGVTDAYVLNSDFSTLSRQLDSATASLERKGDSISNGLCDGFYAQNSTMLNGFNGIQNAISTNGYETRNAITQAQIGQMQSANALQAQLADCCCQNREAIAQVRYDSATQSCATNTNISNSARDIIDSQNANTRAILDALNAQAIASKDAKIAEQNQQIFALQLSASQQAQNAYLIGELAPKLPIASYNVPNPFNGCGCGCGCGC